MYHNPNQSPGGIAGAAMQQQPNIQQPLPPEQQQSVPDQQSIPQDDGSKDEVMDMFEQNIENFIFVEQGGKVELNPLVMKALRFKGGSGTPNSAVETLSSLSVDIALKVAGSAKQKGMPIDGDIVLAGAQIAATYLVSATENTKIYDFSDDESQAVASLVSEKLYKEAQTAGMGDLFPQEKYQQDFNDIRKMSDEGSLDGVLRGDDTQPSMPDAGGMRPEGLSISGAGMQPRMRR